MKFSYPQVIFFMLVILLLPEVYAQQHQVTINRIDQMPDLPQPYAMRNWKEVATQYDNFIFNLNKSGEYLPVIGIKSSGYNDPSLQPILLDTYVGTNSTGQAEAINIIPAIVGASLVGINKSDQNGINWVEKTKDFFNSKNNQHVYLNGYNSNSGNDWWYDLMPNIFFYQLATFYDDPEFDTHIISVADQWLTAVNAMGAGTTPWTVPNMNYRAWRLSNMTGNANGVHEPEAAGAIAWLLYSAYVETGETKYLTGAEHSLEFLSSLNANPSYELQLPYGILTAARLNAIHRTKYDLDKMLNWSFDRGQLRGWGAIVGTWDGKDVSGLIGEANDNGNDYAFLMNGFQQAAALAPLMKYDKRYAREISKWILNLANASRLFYPSYLDANRQDDYAWSSEHDADAVVAYEALKEKWDGKSLYGTGDAKRSGWADTNLGLYGSSHVGYLAAIVNTTDVEGVLKLDLNATDFYGDNRYLTYALFNPHAENKNVTVDLGGTPVDVYEGVSETVVKNNVSGNQSFLINAGEVILITLLPADAELTSAENKLVYNDFVVDYHFGYNFDTKLRIKSLATERSAYEFNETVTVFATVDNFPEPLNFSWFVNGEFMETTSTGEWQWIVPSIEDTFSITVEVASGEKTTTAETTIQVVADVPEVPVIELISADKAFYFLDESATLVAHVVNAGNESFVYDWQVSGGSFQQTDSMIVWTPDAEGLFKISCTVTNKHDLSLTSEISVLVKLPVDEEAEPFAFYPLNVNTNDYSGNNYHATGTGTKKAEDAQGTAASAIRITSTDDVIYVPNTASLNFTNEITVACWVKISASGREAFILSHGSWEERWKISVTPDLKLRWTLKTNQGVKDLDSKEPVVPGEFYHVTAVYSGYSLELYLDGELDNFLAHTGSMLVTAHHISFGQKSINETEYFLNGTLDEVRIYDEALHPKQIASLKNIWVDEIPTAIDEQLSNNVSVFPNPVDGNVVNLNIPDHFIRQINIIRSDGRSIDVPFEKSKEFTTIKIPEGLTGVVVLRVITSTASKNFKIIIR